MGKSKEFSIDLTDIKKVTWSHVKVVTGPHDHLYKQLFLIIKSMLHMCQ